MFQYYRELGLPAGPFDEPQRVYRSATGRGKVHLKSTCNPQLPEAETNLWDLPGDAFCSRCCKWHNLDHYHYRADLQNMAMVANLTAAIPQLLDEPDNEYTTMPDSGASADQVTAWWYDMRYQLGWVTRSERELDPVLQEWARTVLWARTQQTLDVLTGHRAMFSTPDWALRSVAEYVLGDDPYSLSGCPGDMSRGTFDRDAHLGARNAVKNQWRQSADIDRDALIAAGVEAGMNHLGALTKLEQLPPESHGRGAAGGRIDR